MDKSSPNFAAGTSEQINRDCFCTSLDTAALKRQLQTDLAAIDLPANQQVTLSEALFASQPVFVARHHLERMAAVVQAIDQVVALPGYQKKVLSQAPVIARHDDGTRGVLFGYDFHLHHNTLGLIEVNTNAGGVLVNSALIRAQVACCKELKSLSYGPRTADDLESAIVAMFRNEWQLHVRAAEKPHSELSTIAIVDDAPEQQALYPEFVLFQLVLKRQGINAVIADRKDLSIKEGKLWAHGCAIDLVYNRCTDFYLQEPSGATLAQAWLSNMVAVTPNPHHYALYADKRNLIVLHDSAWLKAIGVSESVLALLNSAIPDAVLVTASNTDHLWQTRKKWFFKPATGYGSRAAYRGDKLTRRVWNEIEHGQVYIAQKIVQPGERLNVAFPESGSIKFDLRNYVYDKDVLWTAARLFQGQTTNFRTLGGGFAPVYGLPESVDGKSLFTDSNVTLPC